MVLETKGVSSEGLARLRRDLNQPVVVEEEQYVAWITDRIQDSADAKELAKLIADAARQPQAFDLNEPINAKLKQMVQLTNEQITYFNDKLKSTQFSKEHALAPSDRVYFGSRAQFLKELSDKLPELSKESPASLERIADYFQVSPRSVSIYDFSKVTGLTDAGLTPQQIQALRTSPSLARRFVGTADDFVYVLETALGEAKVPTPNKQILQKVADSAKTALSHPYSKDLTFEQERRIRPEYLDYIRQLVQTTPQGQPVAISWDEWLVYSEPYHGARQNVKPDGSITQISPVPGRPIAPRPEPLRDLLGPTPEGFQLMMGQP
jgi:hypothetical protein